MEETRPQPAPILPRVAGVQNRDRLIKVAEFYGPAPSHLVCDRILAFAGLLLEWNARINLTGAKSLDDLLEEHFPDSFAMAALVPPSARVIDVGSGGGLPAIPFGLLRPDCPLTLVEPRAKRTAFLRTAIREFQMPNVIVLGKRLEDLGGEAGGFSVAASRATFPPEVWLSVAAPLLAPGGRVFVFSTPPQIALLQPPPEKQIPYGIHGEPNRMLASFSVPRET